MKNYLFLSDKKFSIQLCQLIFSVLIPICILSYSFNVYGQEKIGIQPELSTFSSMPQKEYTVGPGDTLFIVVWGEESLSGIVYVGPDGTISMPAPVGILNVSGLTVTQIQNLLTRRLSEYLKNPRITVSIRAFEGFPVHIIGQVKAPTYYKVIDNTTLQELITSAGGMTELADLKHVRLFRTDKEGEIQEEEIDFSLFVKQNDLSANPILKENDVVFIPRISRSERAKTLVTVLGSVAKPGTHELEESLSLLDVLTLAGGLTQLADLRKIWVLAPPHEGGEKTPNSYAPQKISLDDYLTGKDLNANPIVSPGAAIFVESTQLPDEPTFPVNIAGQVIKPGSYQVNETASLAGVLFAAGGFSKWAKIDEVIIIHPASHNPRSEKVDMTKYLISGDIESYPQVFEGDTIIVPLDEKAKNIPPLHTIFSISMTISVIGEVRKPDTYELSQTTNFWEAIIIAGGPTTDADLERAMLIQGVESGQNRIEVDLEKVLTEGQFSLMPILKSGDTIFIPKQKEKVWKQVVSIARDVSTVGLAILIILGRRY
ncbi:SLBB domain-containing protein [bacterium]|nr:SLBB domain-containing protein [bacterium]